MAGHLFRTLTEPAIMTGLMGAIDYYGKQLQSIVAMEEAAELIKAISKISRCNDTERKEDLIEEIADVMIMIEQLKIIYDIDDKKIGNKVAEKIDKLRDHLKKVSVPVHPVITQKRLKHGYNYGKYCGK